MNDLDAEKDLKGAPTIVKTYLVENATCGHCKARIERWVLAQPGVETARFDLESRRLTVVSARGRGPADLEVVAGLAAEGYPARPAQQ